MFNANNFTAAAMSMPRNPKRIDAGEPLLQTERTTVCTFKMAQEFNNDEKYTISYNAFKDIYHLHYLHSSLRAKLKDQCFKTDPQNSARNVNY